MYIKQITLLSLLLTVNIFAQQTVLLKNYNPKVKDLKHRLNLTKDSLVLLSEEKIKTVEIFNAHIEKTIIVDDFNTKIDISNLPMGKFEVEVKLEHKIALMHIVRYEGNIEAKGSNKTSKDYNASVNNEMMLDEDLKPITYRQRGIEKLLSRPKARAGTKKYYWIIYKVNNKLGANKTMKLVDEQTALKLIKRNKLELNSYSAQHNELTVWEVYNTDEFMKKQATNPNFIYASSSDSFNTTPYYTVNTSLKKP
ncbi:hypothetical protein [uncultured Winogradskyella sp.]|uniref:hypothetical protein n=1 Tax=uncultured Winogradskyella sp. TaxID=395353 RepID=UPI0026343FBB|nr:hypothetical protein [uncultured Winogradskyella sp.]